MSNTRRLNTLTVLLSVCPSVLLGQGVAVGAARWLSSPRVSDYRVGVNGFGTGPVRYGVTLQYLRQGASAGGSWGGIGGDFTIRTTPLGRPFLLGGAALGLGRDSAGKGLGLGTSLWGGVGAELTSVGPMGIQAEMLYTWQSKLNVRTISVGLRIGSRIGRDHASARASEATAPLAPALGIPKPAPGDEEIIRGAAAPAAAPTVEMRLHSVVTAALAAMGTPYRWGGTTRDGFDCSGLIQYAYEQQGVSLPRRSADQARYGNEVGREVNGLRPGDILTFAADPGGPVTHVGMYVGDGKFIHSANDGVRVSALTADDPAAKWWVERWVGSRRVLDSEK